ncbi:MAG: alpha/beta hydrolase [Pyrinomonadaceae bacterium]
MKKYKFLIAYLLLTAAGFIAAPMKAQTVTSKMFAAQTANTVSASDYKSSSKLMARQMPYRVMLPPNYATDTQTRFPVIYLLHGLTGHFDNWSDKTKLAEYLAPYNFIVVMPEGNDGWYTDSATVPNDKYESYIIQELIPEIDKNFRTLADREHRAIAGLSMGGYGSLKFGLKHPEMFSLVGSFSGALGAANWTEKEIGTKGAIAESILSVYGAPDSQTRKENNIFQMVKDITPEKVKTLPFIYQSCGTEDFLIQNNHDFQNLLNEKKIPHEYLESPGIHNWVFWDAQIREFLELSDRVLNKAGAKNV